MRPECEQFPPGSHRRAICDGGANLALEKINEYRRKWGLADLAESDRPAERVDRTPKIHSGVPTHDYRPPAGRQSVKSCGTCGKKSTGKTVHVRNRTDGPGTQLLLAYESAGVPHCQACRDLAAKMDEWGTQACRQRLDEIVEDMMPRARAWVAENKPWIRKLLPRVLEDAGIRRKIRSDVLQAIAAAERIGSGRIQVESQGNAPPIETVSLENPRRHLICHLWPVAGHGAWQWNCDRLLENAELFNGRRIVAIATSRETDSASTVMEYLRDFTDQFIVVPNSPKLREVATWISMLERLREYQTEQDVTFACHGKCVRHKIGSDDAGSTIFRWTAAMYELCLSWPAVRPLLETHATAGAFRRWGIPQRLGWGDWHYSGTFFWFRNRDVFARNWRDVPQRFYGTEAWPGRLFRRHEAGLICCDNVADLYDLNYWVHKIEPQIAAWRSEKPSD